MQILNDTPFRFGSLAGRIPFPGHSLTLLVKGTFELQPGSPASIAPGQLYPTGDEYEPEDEEQKRGPRYASDFVFRKEGADVLLVGRCHAPGGRPTPTCPVAIQVGDHRHGLQVTGDRHWRVRDDHWVSSPPEPFVEMPLSYDRAFGGEGFGPNPAGRGFVHPAGEGGQTLDPLPNIEEPDRLVTSPEDRPEPAGFGPLNPGWESRRERLGSYSGNYLRTRWPWFAEDSDPGKDNAAPPPLQLTGYLTGDEVLSFQHLHPEHPLYHSALPGLRVRCFTNREDPTKGWEFAEVDLHIDTLWVDMEAERLVLVWRGWIPVVSSELEDVRHVYIVTEALSEPPDSLEQYREKFARRLAEQAEGVSAEEPSLAGKTAIGVGGGKTRTEEDGRPEGAPEGESRITGDGAPGEKEGAVGEVGSPSESGSTGSFRVTDPDLQRFLSEARPSLDRLGLDSALLEKDDPEEALTRILEKLEDELRAQGFDPEKPPELTAEQRLLQAKIMSDLGIPWNPATGLPDLEEFRPEDPDAVMEETIARMEAELRRQDKDLEHAPEPTPEQKAHLARLGLDFDALKASLEPSTPGAGDEGVEAQEKGAFTPESVQECLGRGESLAGANLSGVQLAGVVLADANLSGAILPGASLAAGDLEGADLRGANLAGSDLRGTKLVNARLDDADLTGADLTGADLSGATLDGVSGEGAVFENAKLEKCSATGALLREANLKNARGPSACLDGADLSGADLEGANLFKASLCDARLAGAHAPKANLAQADVTGLRASRGATFTGASFFRAQGSKPMWMDSDLTDADFRWARMEAPDFTGADLTGARLHAADLPGARFRKATLAGAILTRANLFQGSLERADLTGADLRGSNLFAVEFLEAKLSDSRTDKANTRRTKLALEGGEP